MDILQFEHENIRILATRELTKYGIRLKYKKLPSKKPSLKRRCYAVALIDLETVDVTIREDTVPVPKVFHKLVNFIDPKMNEEGIFRVEGSKAKERTLVRMLDNGYQIPGDTPVVEACAVTKVLLRKIPDNLIPHDLAQWFYEAGSLSDDASEALHLCVLLLPLPNLYLLVYLMQFFNEVASQSARNQMTSSNLAIVIGPNIFPNGVGATVQAQIAHNKLTLHITQILIEEAETLGIVPPALLDRLEELHEEHNAKRKCCTWQVALQVVLTVVDFLMDRYDNIINKVCGKRTGVDQ